MAECTCDGDQVSYPVVPGEPGWDNECPVHGVRALLMTPLKPGTIEKLPERLAELERLANARQSVRLTIWFEPGVGEHDVDDLTEAAIETLSRFRQVEEVTVIETGPARQVETLTEEHQSSIWMDKVGDIWGWRRDTEWIVWTPGCWEAMAYMTPDGCGPFIELRKQ